MTQSVGPFSKPLFLYPYDYYHNRVTIILCVHWQEPLLSVLLLFLLYLVFLLFPGQGIFLTCHLGHRLDIDPWCCDPRSHVLRSAITQSHGSPWRALSVMPFFIFIFLSMAGLTPCLFLIFMAAGTWTWEALGNGSSDTTLLHLVLPWHLLVVVPCQGSHLTFSSIIETYSEYPGAMPHCRLYASMLDDIC